MKKPFLLPASFFILLASALGQVAEPSPQDLATQLAGNNPADIASAITQIHARIAEDPIPAANNIRAFWLKPLLDNNRNAEALDLLIAAITAAPHDLGALEVLQRQRIELLHKMHQNEEALSQSKALFNLTTTAATEQTLLLLAESINLARGNNSPLLEQLISEQRAGSIPSEKPLPSPALHSIHIDSAPYDAAIRALHLPSGELPIAPQQLVALGNLDLLADHPDEALAAFQKFRTLANAPQLRLANESIARALRAEDGTVGRANFFIQSLPH